MHPTPASFRKWFNKVIAMILILIPVSACAQKNRTENVVYLKSHLGLTGVNGTLISAKDSHTEAVRTQDSNVWVFSRSDIKSISREKLIFHIKKQS